MKKYMHLVMFSIFTMILLTGCATKSSSSKTNEKVQVNQEKNSTNKVTEDKVSEEETTQGDSIIEHTQGTVTVPSNIEKAVVFDFGVLDMIDTLGIEVEIAAPVANLPDYLSKYSEVTNAGGIKEPDLEAIFAFEPDVIFIGVRQQDYYEQLSEIAPTVYVQLNGDTYMEDFKNNVGYVAQIFNKQEEAKKHLESIDSRIEEVKEHTQNTQDKALILLLNDGSLSVYGLGSRFGIVHDVLGVKAADDNIQVSNHGQEVNYEYIAQTNPDILFVIDRTAVVGGTTSVDSTLDNDLVNGTNAAKNGMIISLDPDSWYLSGGGLTSVLKMISEIENAFIAE